MMILAILSLCALISVMATTDWSKDWLVWTNSCCDCVIRSAATREFSLFLRAIELTSSLDADVSSSDAACSEDPCASDWLEEETSAAALATCSAPSDSPVTTCRSVRVMLRITKNASANPPREHETVVIARTQSAWP